MDVPPVQYVRTSDGYDIAYAVTGSGQPLVLPSWSLNDILSMWYARRSWMDGLASRFRLVQFDFRGRGLSSHGLLPGHTNADWNTDLATVIDELGLERIILFGVGGFGHAAVRHTIANPDRVAALVLNTTPVSIAASYPQSFIINLAGDNWEYYVRLNMPPGLGPDQTNDYLARWLNPATHQDWKIMAPVSSTSNIEAELPRLRTPTLVLHSKGSPIPPAESIRMAAGIRDARLVMIEGNNMAGDASEGLAALDAFLANLTVGRSKAKTVSVTRASAGTLSVRELEVLRLLAAGRSNPQIAEALVISPSTVAKHVSNIFDKTGTANRAQGGRLREGSRPRLRHNHPTMDAPPIRYITTKEGYRLAFSTVGRGAPCVVVPPGLNHIRLVWQLDVYRPWLTGLAGRFTLVQYDGRGQGLSTRNPAEFGQEDRVADLETVVEGLSLPPAVLFAVGSAGHPAIRFAARHPDRVLGLILMGCSITSEPWPAALVQTLAETHWETYLAIAAGRKTVEEGRAIVELLKQMVTKEDYTRMTQTFQSSSVVEEVSQVKAPALVFHLRDLSRRPSLEDSAELAASFTAGRLVEIPGGGIVTAAPSLVGDYDAAAPHIDDFTVSMLESVSAVSSVRVLEASPLSRREIEVLRLIAAGRSNQQIAHDLVISLNTVRRHVSNIFDKTGAANRAQAAVYAKDHGLA
jgi:DNA-binding NarL/FixJ family response regulator